MKLNPTKMFMIMHIQDCSFGHRDVLVMYVADVHRAQKRGSGLPLLLYVYLFKIESATESETHSFS